eukprot:gene22577-30842_t
MLPNPVEERTYESWPIYFGATDGMFYPYHYCDCSREQISCGGEISSTLSEYEYPDLPELLLQHVANLQPNGPLDSNNTSESFSNDSSTTYDSSSLHNPNKIYAIVLSAGFWPSKFHNVDYSKKVIEAALNFDRKKKRDFDAIDEVVCAIPRVECMDVSWTRSLDRQYYWDDKHFKAPVYNKIVDQIAAQIHKAYRR